MNALKEDNGSQYQKELLHETSAGKNQGLFRFYVLFISYILITVAATSDLDLLMPEGTILLPVLDVDIPLYYFYLFASPLVLIFHSYLLHSKAGYLQKIKKWGPEPKGKPNASSYEQPSPSNFLNLSPQGYRGLTLIFLADVVLFFLAPLCLFYIQWQFSAYQNSPMTLWHFICLLVVVIALLYSKEKEIEVSVSGNQVGKYRILIRKAVLIFIILSGFANLCFVAILHNEKITNIFINWQVETYKGKEIDWGKAVTLWFIPKINFPSDRDEENLSFADLKISNLSGRRLMFADLSNNDMEKILFRGAYLQGANLEGSILDRAKMEKARLQGANLDARLRKANLEEAKLQGAYMKRVDLRKAKMAGAELQGASMGSAEMQGVDMGCLKLDDDKTWKCTQLQGADMNNAELQGANLDDAQLQGANMKKAELQGASLRGAQLQGADMYKTELQGASMEEAQLQGANMEQAQLQGADLWDAQLQGVYIKRAKFHGANTGNTAFNGSFCKSQEDSFFDRVNGRIVKPGLDGCKTEFFGKLKQGTVNEIIKDLRKNKKIPARIIRRAQKRIADRVRRSATVKEGRKGELTFGAACEIIKNWEKDVKDVSRLKHDYTDWLKTDKGKKSELKKCKF